MMRKNLVIPIMKYGNYLLSDRSHLEGDHWSQWIHHTEIIGKEIRKDPELKSKEPERDGDEPTKSDKS